MTGASWLLAGGVIGLLNALALWWTVARVRPNAPRCALAWAVGSAPLRWSLAAGLLMAALLRGVLPGLLAFAGLWLARWGTVCWLSLRPPSNVLFEDREQSQEWN